MPETAIADGPGHANLLRQRHLQTSHALLPLKVMQLFSRDKAHVPGLILGALGGIWRVGMASSRAGL